MDNAQIRVLHITSGLGTGGAEAILRDLLESLGQFNVEQLVISLGPVEEAQVRLNYPLVKIHFFDLRRHPWRLVSVIAKIVFAMAKFRPDVVHTWMYHADLIGGILGKLKRLPVVWGIFSGNLEPEYYRPLTRLTIRMCGVLSRSIPAEVLSVSRKGRAVHESIGYPSKKIRVVPIGFDTEQFSPKPGLRIQFRKTYGFKQDQPIIGMVARFDRQKDFDTLFKAASKARVSVPGLKIVLVGGYGITVENSALTEKVEMFGLGSVVRLLGFVESIEEFYNGIDLLVLTSFGEGFPRVLGEAMATGVPCVSTKVGDAEEIIGSTGCIVGVGDVSGLADAMESFFASSPESRDYRKRESRKRITEEYSLLKSNSSYAEVYRRLAVKKSH